MLKQLHILNVLDLFLDQWNINIQRNINCDRYDAPASMSLLSLSVTKTKTLTLLFTHTNLQLLSFDCCRQTTLSSDNFCFSLGAVHDGDQNSCSSADHFIMAATSTAVNARQEPSLARNPFIFSTCSVSEMNSLLNTLGK